MNKNLEGHLAQACGSVVKIDSETITLKYSQITPCFESGDYVYIDYSKTVVKLQHKSGFESCWNVETMNGESLYSVVDERHMRFLTKEEKDAAVAEQNAVREKKIAHERALAAKKAMDELQRVIPVVAKEQKSDALKLFLRHLDRTEMADAIKLCLEELSKDENQNKVQASKVGSDGNEIKQNK